MNTEKLQRAVDHLIEASGQQWIFRAVGVATSLAAVLAGSAADDRLWVFGLFLVGLLAVVSALVPDSDVALIVIIIVTWRWLATVDSVDTPWLPVAAVCLLCFHSVTALAASLPTGGAVRRSIIGRWLHHTAVVGALTVGTWSVVLVFERRDAAGNGPLTALALAVVVGAASLIRWRGIDRPSGSRFWPTPSKSS